MELDDKFTLEFRNELQTVVYAMSKSLASLLTVLSNRMLMKTSHKSLPILLFTADVFERGIFKYHLSVHKIRERKPEGKIFRCTIAESTQADQPLLFFDLVKDRHGRWVDVEKGITEYTQQLTLMINEKYAEHME